MSAVIPNTDLLHHLASLKRAEVARLQSAMAFSELEASALSEESPRNFFTAVTRHAGASGEGGVSVIADVSRKSASGTWLRAEFGGSPASREALATLARRYSQAGASAISVPTDAGHLGGSLGDLRVVKEATDLPVLRRDLIVDPWQIWESRAAGADAVILTSEILPEGQLLDMLILAQRLGLTSLIEVHSMEHLLRVRHHVGFPHPSYCLLSISNRNAATLEPDLTTTLRLADMVEDRGVLVSDAGVSTARDLARLRRVGVQIAIVGEALMASEDPAEALAMMLRPPATENGAMPKVDFQ